MKRILIIAVCLFFQVGCNTGGSDTSNLRPRTTASEAVIANLNLAFEYMRQGNYEAALEKLDRAQAADPEYHGTYNAYGLMYQRIGYNKQAEVNFKKALALNPADSGTMNNYGSFLCQIGKTDKAEDIFIKAAKNPLYDTPEAAITNAGYCKLINKEYDSAKSYFRQALDINPQVPVALLGMCQLSYDDRKYLPARGYLERYAAVAPHNADSLLLGIKIEQKLGNRDKVSSYSLLLRSNFPRSEQVKQLDSMGIR